MLPPSELGSSHTVVGPVEIPVEGADSGHLRVVAPEGRLKYLGFKVDRTGKIHAGRTAHDIIREATHLLPSVSSTVTWACRFCNAVVGGQLNYYGPFARYEPSSLTLLDARVVGHCS
jgi:hypothetical protein